MQVLEYILVSENKALREITGVDLRWFNPSYDTITTTRGSYGRRDLLDRNQ